MSGQLYKLFFFCFAACCVVAMLYVSQAGSTDQAGKTPVNVEQIEAETESIEPLVPPFSSEGIVVESDPAALSPFDHDDSATFHPHGERVCATGCALSNHPTGKLNVHTFRKLIAEFAREPISASSPALDALLFHGRQTSDLIESHGCSPLDSQRREFLKQQLATTHVRVAIRIVDEHGVVRASCKPARVPLHRRHVFSLSGNNLQPLVASGTVKRVGLDYLWTRL